jgi:sensor histidine kinase regulating citrate/malate metabolism
MLHGIREGVLGYDEHERIVLANDFARQLLDLPPDFVGRPLRQVLPPGRLADLVTGAIEGNDLLVRDSGPGVPNDMREAIFMDGVTTKSSATGARRGLGLALVRQVVTGRGGMISVGHDGGAVFTAVLPKCVGVAGAAPEAKEAPVSP